MSIADEEYKLAEGQIEFERIAGTKSLSMEGLLKLERLPPQLAELTSLKTLNLSGCWQVSDLSVVAGLTALQTLNLSWCEQVSDLSVLAGLTALQTLDLSGCPQVSDLSALVGLTALQTLNLSWCEQVSDLSALAGLTALQTLNLVRCEQLSDVSALAGLTALQTLDLVRCEQLSDVSALAGLTALQTLDLSGCPQVSDLSALAGLTVLWELELRFMSGGAPLRPLTPLFERLVALRLFGSVFSDLPAELCGKDELENVIAPVRAHFAAQAQQGVREDQELKVIVLGNGRVGKTSLVKALQGLPHDPLENSTHGIRLWTLDQPWQPLDGEGAEAVARLNVWDFAGQDLYHQTHRLFFQARAIFIIVHAENEPPLQAGEEDVRRPLRYWLEQVASLETAGRLPPVLVVRNRCDEDRPGRQPRDWRGDAPWECRELPELACSAATGAGIEALRQWLGETTAQVLGSQEKRGIGAGRAAVKQELRALQAANEAAHRESERTGRRHEPPHALMPRAEFHALVREKCAGTDDAADPDQVLDWLHRQGALYWNRGLMPEQVILDQRWAIEGIYALFHREKCVRHLRRRQGRFTAPDLAQWLWDGEGYTPEEQRVFVNFMLACGIAFTLLEKEEAAEGEAVYVAPECLPPAAVTEAELVERLRGADLEAARPARVLETAHRHLSAEPVLHFLCRVGRKWKRAALMWRHGAFFQSGESRSWIRVDWQRGNEDDYGGKLRLELHGTDAGFLEAVVEEVRGSPGFPHEAAEDLRRRCENLPTETLKPPAPPKPPEPAPPETAPAKAPPLEAYAPPPEAQVKPRVGFSFAGEDAEHPGIESRPRALAAALRASGVEVKDYKTDQETPHLEVFLRELVAQDFLVVFISRKYLRSEYCMWELMKIFEREPAGVFVDDQCRLLWFKDARLSHRPDGTGALTAEDWLGFWKKRAAETARYYAAASGEDALRAKQAIERDFINEWLAFIHSSDKGDLLVKHLLDHRLGEVLDAAAQDTEIQAWCAALCEKLNAMLTRPERLPDYAKSAWQRGDREQARGLLLRHERVKPGNQARSHLELLKSARFPHDRELEDMRKILLAEELDRE